MSVGYICDYGYFLQVTYENVEKPMPSIAEIQIRHDQIDRYRRDPTATKPKRRSLLQIMVS